jgi:hypothetical protein
MLRDLAYAAFHCSSLRALAASTSPCETKREPTTPDEIEGMASSSAMVEMMMQAGGEVALICSSRAPPHSVHG